MTSTAPNAFLTSRICTDAIRSSLAAPTLFLQACRLSSAARSSGLSNNSSAVVKMRRMLNPLKGLGLPMTSGGPHFFYGEPGSTSPENALNLPHHPRSRRADRSLHVFKETSMANEKADLLLLGPAKPLIVNGLSTAF